MSPLTRRFLITAAAFLLLGVGLGLVLLVRRELGGHWPTRGLIDAHSHLILVGAVIELIIGVAWWLFPRPVGGRAAVPETAVAVAWWALTVGTAARALGEAVAAGVPGGRWAAVIIAGGTLQVAGLVAAVLALRHRIRPARTL